LRYKYEDKDIAEPIENTKQIVARIKRTIRGEIIYSVSNKIRVKGRFEYASFNISATGQSENGYLIFQDIRYAPTNYINFYGRLVFFQTDSYFSAIYEYENNLTGVLTNIPLFYQGIRWYLMMRYRPINLLTFSFKYSETFKPAEKSIGSGENIIPGNLDNIIAFQLDMNL